MDAMSSPWFVRLLNSLGRSGCIIIVMHRFASEDGVHRGHDPAELRLLLSTLRNLGVSLIDVDQAVRLYDDASTSHSPKGLSVAFTVDDGYADLIEFGAPVFAEFDCPVSGFVVPQAVERIDWFWWDKLDWVFRHSDCREVVLETSQGRSTVKWSDEISRLSAKALVEATLKQLADESMASVLERFAQAAQVAIPSAAPEEYRVLSWEELRSAEGRGLRFGAHSETHPILSRCSNEKSSREIIGSVDAVRTHLLDPVQLFCYPNGTNDDFGEREYRAIKRAGLRYALTTIPGAVRRGMADSYGADWRMRIPRLSYSEEAGYVLRSFL